MAEEMNVQIGLLENVDERNVHWLLERMEAFSAIPYVSENAYVRRLIETLLTIGARGHAVIVGRGAPHALPQTTTLRVRLVAEFEFRVRNVMAEMGLTHGEAARKVKAVERERRHFLKDHFHIDPEDPVNYDLLLNTTHIPVAGCVEIIEAALHVRERERGGLIEALAAEM
jgi:cytidylate kinase